MATAMGNLLPDWVRCSQDELGKRQLVEAKVRAELKNGKNVLIDVSKCEAFRIEDSQLKN